MRAETDISTSGRSTLRVTCLLVGAIVCFMGGMLAYRYLPVARSAVHVLKGKLTGTSRHSAPWAIGIYRGESPFQLMASSGVDNPVIAPEDITDFEAWFVADPFLSIRNGAFTMFFEVVGRASGQGDIGFATSADASTWTYGGIALEEPFHLSYPYVFEWEGNY